MESIVYDTAESMHEEITSLFNIDGSSFQFVGTSNTTRNWWLAWSKYEFFFGIKFWRRHIVRELAISLAASMTPTHLLFRCLCLYKPTVDTLLSSLYRTPKSHHRATCPNRQTAPKASISSSSLNHISTSSIDIRTVFSVASNQACMSRVIL